MTTSNTYNFGNTPTDEIIREAFERCGVPADAISGLQVRSALSSLNYMFSEWINRGLNLFTIEQSAFEIVNKQSTYNLPPNTIDVLEVSAAVIIRVLEGIPFSSNGGNAQNAFDGNPATSCTQNAPNGFISYDYEDKPINIQYIGVQSNQNIIYTLLIQYSYDNTTWFTAINPGPQAFIQGKPLWFVPQTPQKARYWRIIETQGATLDIQEIYFDIPNYNRLLTRLSREEYISIPNKFSSAIPSSYVVYRNLNPTLTLWPNPDSTYQIILYNRMRYIQDVNDMLETVDAPQRFIEATVSGLAARLAQKFYADRYPLLKDLAEQSYQYAAKEDIERVPLRIMPNLINYT